MFDNNDTTSSKGEFITSAVGDGTDIDALDFAVAEVHPDDLTRLFVHNQLIYMFGSDSVQPWWNSGVGRPPFDSVQSGARAIGIAGRDAITEQDGLMYFLDDDRIPRKMTGFDTLPMGTNPLGKEFASYSTVSDCIVWGVNFDHQDFIVYTFPTASRTWCFHVPSNSWFQLADGVGDERYRGAGHLSVYDKHLIPDYQNGKVYELDFDTSTDNGNTIQRKRTTASIHSGLYAARGVAAGREMWFNKVEFDVQVGEGIATGQGSDPQLMIRYSDDGGLTYSAEEMYPLGKGGDYLRKVELFQQGNAFQRVYELIYSEPTKFALFSAHADIDFG